MEDDLRKEFKKHKNFVKTQDKDKGNIKKRMKLVEDEVKELKELIKIQKTEKNKSLSEFCYFFEESMKNVADQLRMILKVQQENTESLNFIKKGLKTTENSFETVSDQNFESKNFIKIAFFESESKHSPSRSLTCPESTTADPEP